MLAEQVDRETEILWMREMIAGSYVPTFVPVDTPQGPVEALTFVANRQSRQFYEADAEETVRLIASGKGMVGTSLEYLEKLTERLQLVGLSDPAMAELLARTRVHALHSAET